MKSANPDLENIADQLRHRFVEKKRLETGKPYTLNARYRNREMWLKAASACVQAKADPEDWLNAIFAYNSTPGGPYPNQLYSSGANMHYKNYVQSTGTNRGTNSKFQREINYVKRIVQQKYGEVTDETIEEFVKRGHVDVSPWLKILLIPDDSEVYKENISEAQYDIENNPALREFIGENFSLGIFGYDECG